MATGFNRKTEQLLQQILMNQQRGYGARHDDGGGGGNGGSGWRSYNNRQDRYGGKTYDQALAIIQAGGWIGVRQWTQWQGRIYCSNFRKGDKCCSNCKCGTVRPDRTRCWICAKWLGYNKGDGPGSDGTKMEGGMKTTPPTEKMPETSLSKDMPLTAEQWAANRKKPPNTPAVAIARQSAPPTTCLGDESDADLRDDDGTTDDVEEKETKLDADILNASQLASVKALLDHPSMSATARTALQRHADASAEKDRLGFAAKADAVNVAGKTFSQVVLIRERHALAMRQDKEEFETKKATDMKDMKEQHEQARADFTEQLKRAQLHLKNFEDKVLEEKRVWDAHYLQLEAKHAAKVAAAEEALTRAREALKNAPDPYAVVQAEGNDPGAQDVTMGSQQQQQQQLPPSHQQPQQPRQLLPFIPPPQLTPPNDPEMLKKLHDAKAVVQLWLVQDSDWPLTPENVGLTVEQCAQLAGPENWARAACLTASATLPKSTIGVLSAALTQLEVNTAHSRAAEAAAQKTFEDRVVKKCKTDSEGAAATA